jgi:hypothetical protein
MRHTATLLETGGVFTTPAFGLLPKKPLLKIKSLRRKKVEPWVKSAKSGW